MKVRRNVRCIHCGKHFIPNLRLGMRQKTCGSKECKRLHNLSAQRRWKKKYRYKNWGQKNRGQLSTYNIILDVCGIRV